MENIRIGIIGYAAIAQKAIIPAVINSAPYFTLAGIATRGSEKSAAISQQFSCKVYEGYDAILDPSVVDAVYIPLPNALHYEWVKKALEKGIHVLVEKSLACTLEEVVSLNDLARKHDCTLIENFQFRFHSQLQFIKKAISSGTLGELRSIRSNFAFPPFADQDNIRYKKELGGGALLDAGAYPIKLAQELLGFDLEMQSAMLNFQDKAVDIWGSGSLKQRSGPLFMQFFFGFDSFYQCNVEIIGTKGKLVANRIFTAPPGFEPEIIIETASGRESHVLKSENHYENMLRHFHSCIGNPQSNDAEYRHNIVQATLLDQFKNLANE